MLTIAIVEDSLNDAEQLQNYIEKWKGMIDEGVQVSVYNCALDFLSVFKGQFDIVFLDIMLPDKDGVSIAKSIRKIDPYVILVFTTNMRQYAINGYEVEALDFMLKPISYPRFTMLMKKCMVRHKARIEKGVVLKIPGTTYCLNIEDICFVEVQIHDVIYTLSNGDKIRQRGTMSEVEKMLPASQFSRCSISHLVNLRHVERINGEYVVVSGEELKITRGKNKEFRAALSRYYSE